MLYGLCAINFRPGLFVDHVVGGRNKIVERAGLGGVETERGEPGDGRHRLRLAQAGVLPRWILDGVQVLLGPRRDVGLMCLKPALAPERASAH